jgi:uncharacterized protein YerC
MRVRSSELKDSERVETLDALYTAAGAVSGRDATKRFLKDLLTESERIMLGRRILVARALLTGKTFDEIVDELHAGKDTIMRIDHWLEDQMPGYEDALAGMEKEFADRQKKADDKKLYATSALYRLKKKYPMHFLLFPTPKLKR